MPRLLLLFILFTTSVSAQFTDRYWVFGDSAAIDFKNLSSPQPAMSVLQSEAHVQVFAIVMVIYYFIVDLLMFINGDYQRSIILMDML
ncbi:MAG: hypothetical protein IPK10_06465 [Bacteroidetes bacterium]|nr:hypothetical protein [Bacteroidota bacterium]